MKNIILLLFAIFSAAPLQAQRYLPGQWAVQVSGGFVECLKLFKKEDGYGRHLNLSFSKYTEERNRWMYGVNFSEKYLCNKECSFPVNQYIGDISYWFPFVSDRGKNVFLSAGVGLNGGYQQISSADKSDDNNKFLYGGFVGLEMELFLTNRWIFVINARERYLRSSPYKNTCKTGDFRFNLGLGIKYILNY